jgi:pilus assembly protein CpaE
VTSAPRVLVVDRDAELTARLRQHVAPPDAIVKRCADLTRADRVLAESHWDVVVAGPSLMHRQGLRRLGSLHRRHPWAALVLALRDRPSVDLTEIVQVGADDLAPLHLDNDEIRRTLERAVRISRRRLGSGASVDQGRVIMVSSASGGCGKTFLATNAAQYLTRHTDRPVVLFDLDLQFGEVSTALRLRPDLTICDALAAEAEGHNLDETLEEYLLHHPDGFEVLAAPRLPAEADSVMPGDITRILEALRARGAWVVVDTHEGLDDLTLPVLDVVDHVFAVATPDRPSLVNMARYVATLERLGVEPGRVSIVLNKVDSDSGFDPVGMAAELGRQFAAMVPYSRDAARSLNVGVPLITGKPKSHISMLLTAALSRALPGSAGPSRSTVRVAGAPSVTQPSATDPANPVPTAAAVPCASPRPTGPEEESSADDSQTAIGLRHPRSRRCSIRQARPIGRCRPSVERVAGVPCRGRGPPPGLPGLRPGPLKPLVNRLVPTRPPSLVRS